MQNYRIVSERDSKGYFIGWSIHRIKKQLQPIIYPLYEIAETEALRQDGEESEVEAE